MGGALRAGTHGEGCWKGVTQEVLAVLGLGAACVVLYKAKMMLECAPEVILGKSTPNLGGAGLRQR